jgi:hypothetical protein
MNQTQDAMNQRQEDAMNRVSTRGGDRLCHSFP